jgi:hypothetical protein
MNPFLDVSVTPMYGKLSARILWRLQQGYDNGVCVIFKSPDGLNNWKELGKAPANLGGFIDDNLLFRGRLDESYYRVVLQRDGKRFDSDVISTFGRLSRQEFGIARAIMEHEWNTLRRFTPVKFFKLKSDGPRCSRCVDTDTQQKIGTSLCPICYGTTFEGGYYPAVDSFMQVGMSGPKVRNDSREGAGSSDPVSIRARMSAYPLMEKEDLIVNPAADRRYLIDTIDYGYFNGKIPVHVELTLQMLARNDIRYQFPL